MPHALAELRLNRIDHNLCDVQRMIRYPSRVIMVRYTRTEIVVIYRA